MSQLCRGLDKEAHKVKMTELASWSYQDLYDAAYAKWQQEQDWLD